MSDQQNLTDLLEEIKAVSDENVLYCDIPYNVFIGEAEGLHTRATLDLPLLQTFNFDAAKLDRLLVCTGALRTAQSNWEAKKTAKAMALENWKKEAPTMYALHNDLIDNMEFAFRDEDSLLAKLAEIKEGDSNADTVQDMASLSVLGKENPDLLTAINFDLTQLDTAAEIADQMGTLLGEINGRMYFEDDIKLIRDKAYTLTKAVVDEVRSYGKFVFRKDEEKRRAYASKYNRNRQAEYRRSKAEEDYEANQETLN